MPSQTGTQFGNIQDVLVTRGRVQTDIVGQENTGGIAGMVHNAISLVDIAVKGQVHGRKKVGGMIGFGFNANSGSAGTQYEHRTFLLKKISFNGDVKGESMVGGAIGYHSREHHNSLPAQLQYLALKGTVAGEDQVGGRHWPGH